MTDELQQISTNRVLVVDDDETLVNEYLRCLGEDFEADAAITTLTDLEKVLFGEETDERGAARFEVHSRNQGEAAVEAVAVSIKFGKPYSIVFIDIRMPPGMNGIEVLRQMKKQRSDIPVILSSAYQEFQSDISTWASEEYIVKSGNLDGLKDAVKRLLSLE